MAGLVRKPREETNPQSTDSHGRRVRSVYQLGSARWYEPFRRLWTRLTSGAAEAELDRLIREEANAGWRVLDIGCGTGHNLGRLLRLGVPFAAYRGLDLTEAMLDIAREHYEGEDRARFEKADLHQLAGSSEPYGLILCTWVASHLEEPRDVFEIAYRLLVPGGQALFLTMTRPRWYIRFWFTPFTRLFQTRYLQPEALGDLPGMALRRSWTAGLVTLIQLRKPESAHGSVRWNRE